MTNEEKTVWLATLEEALYKCIAGQIPQSLISPDGSITYTRPDANLIKAEISILRNDLGLTTTSQSARMPIYLGI